MQRNTGWNNGDITQAHLVGKVVRWSMIQFYQNSSIDETRRQQHEGGGGNLADDNDVLRHSVWLTWWHTAMLRNTVHNRTPTKTSLRMFCPTSRPCTFPLYNSFTLHATVDTKVCILTLQRGPYFKRKHNFFHSCLCFTSRLYMAYVFFFLCFCFMFLFF